MISSCTFCVHRWLVCVERRGSDAMGEKVGALNQDAALCSEADAAIKAVAHLTEPMRKRDTAKSDAASATDV